MAKKRGLGAGLGALIPPAAAPRGVDVLIPQKTSNLGTETGTDGFEPGAKTPGAVQDLLNPTTMRNSRNRKGKDAQATDLVPVPGAVYAELPLDAVQPNHAQPRSYFDEDALEELAQSIRLIGVQQPIIVRPLAGTKGRGKNAKFELIMGERRLRASKLAGKETIPAIVRDTADEDMLRDALLENLHRADLNPLEEAAAYQQLIDDFGCTQEVLAKKIARSRPQISNTLRLLKLPASVQMQVAAGVISAGHARALLSLDGAAAMEAMCQRIIAEGLSVRNVEELIALGDADAPAPKRQTRQAQALSPELIEAKSIWEDTFQTRVNLKLGKTKGTLTIEFADAQDLARLTKLLGK